MITAQAEKKEAPDDGSTSTSTSRSSSQDKHDKEVEPKRLQAQVQALADADLDNNAKVVADADAACIPVHTTDANDDKIDNNDDDKIDNKNNDDDDSEPSACAVWDGAPHTTLRAAMAVLWPVRFPTLSSAKKAARRGEVWVNGQRCKGRRSSTLTVQPGDRVGRQQLAPRRARETAATDRAPTLILAYLDPVLAVVVKPAGMSVMSGKKTDGGVSGVGVGVGAAGAGVLTLHRLLFHKLPPPLPPSSSSNVNVNSSNTNTAIQPLPRPSPCHRLDKLTAGLVVVARTVPCARDVTATFEARQVTKRYRAILHGRVGMLGTLGVGIGLEQGESGESGEITAALDGRECRSEWRVVERLVLYSNDADANNANRNLTLVDLFPHTGRKHQLRRHCRKMGHPIVGDPRYGLERDDAALSASLSASASTSTTTTSTTTTSKTTTTAAAGEQPPLPPPPLSLMLAAVDLKLAHPEAHYAARTRRTDPDVDMDVDNSGSSWAFAAESSCSCAYDPADGTLRVQMEMPPAMRRLVAAGTVRSTTTST
jgi:23S rRNA-/tRNA-specific pseudouridylate synthase